MFILRTRNKISDFLKILAWASPFNNFIIAFDLRRLLSQILSSKVDPRAVRVKSDSDV